MVKIDSEGKEVLSSKQTELTKMFSWAGSVAVAFRKALAGLQAGNVTYSLCPAFPEELPLAGTALEDTGRGWGVGVWEEGFF